MPEADRLGATPFDVPGVELGHHGPLCSFDAFIRKYALNDPALERLALIVRGADTDAPDLAPEVAGLVALSWGLHHNYQDDHELLAQGMVMYDATLCLVYPFIQLECLHGLPRFRHSVVTLPSPQHCPPCSVFR